MSDSVVFSLGDNKLHEEFSFQIPLHMEVKVQNVFHFNGPSLG